MARAPVSKTGGWGFETLHPCQRAPGFWSYRLGGLSWVAGVEDLAASPIKFVREVRAEVAKVTWPSRRDTMVTTGLVLAMTVLVALFFLVFDQAIGMGVRALFGLQA